MYEKKEIRASERKAGNENRVSEVTEDRELQLYQIGDERVKEREVFRACCGEDEDGFSRAGVAVTFLLLKTEPETKCAEEGDQDGRDSGTDAGEEK